MKRVLILMILLFLLIPLTFAMASDSSPYIMGEWKHNVTDDTEFSFLNPTNLTLLLAYAFFDENGNFCGCDIDILNPNGTVQYTTAGEEKEGLMQCSNTHGALKSVVFEKIGKRCFIGNALHIGFQTHISTHQCMNMPMNMRTESDMKAISLNHGIRKEIAELFKKCEDFLMISNKTIGCKFE